MDKKSLLTGRLDLKKRMIKSTIWSIVLYIGETWTLLLADRKRLEMWIWRRMNELAGRIR